MERILHRVHRAFSRPVLRRLLLLSALLLLFARFHPAAEVSVGGEVIGKFAFPTLRESVASASAAAFEITGRETDLRENAAVRFCLTAEPYSRDTRRLERALLASAPGVKRLWVASAGDQTLGVIADPSVLGELQQVLVDSYAGPCTVDVRIEPELTLRRSFVRADAALSDTEISLRLREMLTVETRELP